MNNIKPFPSKVFPLNESRVDLLNRGDEPDALFDLEFYFLVIHLSLLKTAFSRFIRLRSYPFLPLGVEWKRVGLGTGTLTLSRGFVFIRIFNQAAFLVRRLSFLIFPLTWESAFLSFC